MAREPEVEVGAVEVQLLHIAECPNWQDTATRLRQVMDGLALAAVEVGHVTVHDEADAAALSFAGSPTILIDGKDLFPQAGTTGVLACRIYPTASGPAGAPTTGMLETALRERLTSRAAPHATVRRAVAEGPVPDP